MIRSMLNIIDIYCALEIFIRRSAEADCDTAVTDETIFSRRTCDTGKVQLFSLLLKFFPHL